jgi:hypothetical protein
LERIFIEAGSSEEAKSKVTMSADDDSDFNILGSLSIVVRLRRHMGPSEIDFAPSRISKGSSIHVVTGTNGEMAKINRNGELQGPTVTPFPTSIIDGVILDKIWVGIWLDVEFRQARMAALPIEIEWNYGSSREDLRSSINSVGGEEVLPSNSLWHRVLDSQPMKIGKYEDKVVFTTVSGIYMIDSDANEIWRGLLPRWPSISNFSAFDEIVGVVEFPGGISIWSRAGGVSVLDPSSGLEIYSRVIDFGDSVSDVTFSDEGGWFVMLHEGSIAVMDKIEEHYSLFRTSGPVLDAEFSDGSWKWTGWRHDGSLTDSEPIVTDRENIGVAITDGNILTNDGSWSRFQHY